MSDTNNLFNSNAQNQQSMVPHYGPSTNQYVYNNYGLPNQDFSFAVPSSGEQNSAPNSPGTVISKSCLPSRNTGWSVCLVLQLASWLVKM